MDRINWYFILLKPETIKGIGYAISQPSRTCYHIARQTYDHSIGMIVNMSMCWVTGRCINAAIYYGSSIVKTNIPTDGLPCHHHVAKETVETVAATSDILSTTMQVGQQILSLGKPCCLTNYVASGASQVASVAVDCANTSIRENKNSKRENSKIREDSCCTSSSSSSFFSRSKANTNTTQNERQGVEQEVNSFKYS